MADTAMFLKMDPTIYPKGIDLKDSKDD